MLKGSGELEVRIGLGAWLGLNQITYSVQEGERNAYSTKVHRYSEISSDPKCIQC